MASAERNRVLVGELVSRAAIAAIDPASATEAAIGDAIAGCDYERAATLAFARATAGAPLPIELVAAILPGIELHTIASALIAIATGDKASALLDLLARRRFPLTKDAAELEAIALYAAWRAGAPIARLIPEVRRLAVRSLTAESYALVATIAAAIDDPNVAAATKHVATFAKDYAKQVASDDRALAATIADVLAQLPAEVETGRGGGFTVRAAKPIGRNDPCPCGSGLKYKKCCADKPVDASSPIPGLSWRDFLGSGADRMTADHVADLALRDLARVELARLGSDALVAAGRRFARAHEWAHARRAIDELAGRDAGRGAELRDELVDLLLGCGAIELAREEIAKLPAELAVLWQLEVAIADGPAAAWTALVGAADSAVRGAPTMPEVELALSLLRTTPALGVLLARACLGAGLIEDGQALLDGIEDARDRLNLAPDDPAWGVFDELTARKQPRREAADDPAAMQAALRESSARADQLERALAQMRAELDDARTLPAAELARAPAEHDRASGLEAKVRELEALIREGNEERRELRKQLQRAPADPASARHARGDAPRARAPAAPPAADADDAVAEPIATRARDVIIPRFERRVIDALDEVPAAVAAEAMRTIGTLAAGDGYAWRSVKQAKDMSTPVLMARVGIHHRLLFRAGDGALDVVDLVTREQLLTTLKRLRSRP